MATAQQRSSLGRYGEDVAARHLSGAGMTVLDRNWRCAAGELDLVLRDGGAVVFCEVKTRRDSSFGHPLEAVTPAKAQRLHRLAALWLAEHDVHAADVRLDLVAVLVSGRGAAVVDHVRGVG